jgi:hypothetical protein
VNPLPVISAVTFPPVFCAGTSGSIIASGASTYTWSNGTSGSSTLVNPTVSTVYTATGTSVQGCKNTGTVMVNVNTNSLTVTQNTTICKGNSVNLVAGGVVTALWSNGFTFLTNPVSPSVTTIYSVSGSDPLGCTLSNTVQVTVNNVPAVTASSNKQSVCRGDVVTLSATGATSYLWDNGDANPTSTRTLAVNIPYYFSVTGTDANGCSSTATITVTADACLGISENEMITAGVFPNPASKEITVTTTGSGIRSITVADMTGKVVLTVKTEESSYRLNIENLPSGIYHVRVTGEDIIKDHKLVKQ